MTTNLSIKRLSGMIQMVFLLLLLGWTTTGFSIGAGRIEGTVFDAQTHKEVLAAKVELLNASDSSIVKIGLTDTAGRYTMNDIAFGKYALRFSGLSYKKYLISNIDISSQKPLVKFGNTLLEQDLKALNEVKVYGYKMTGEMIDDKTVYTINDKTAAVAQSGLDLLRQIPEVEVDFLSNEVRVAGSTNVLYIVNGQRVDKNYLMQLNPTLIDKVEVITNPGAKYDADVDAVINIILKKNIGYGISARISPEIPTSKYYFSYSNAGIDYFVKNVRLYVSGNYGIENWDLDIIRDRVSTSGTENVQYHQYGRGLDREGYGGFSYGADWFINDHNTFTVSSYVQPKIPNHIDLTSNMTYHSVSEDSHTQTKSLASFQNTYSNYAIFYKHAFSKKDHEITFESNYNETDNIRIEDYYERLYDANDSLTQQHINQRYQIKDNGRLQYMAKTDYTYPITTKIKLSVGAQGDMVWVNNSYTERVSVFYDKLNYRENRVAAYTNLGWSIGKVDLQSGVRYELSDIHIDHSGNTTTHYDCFLPFQSGQYKLGEKQTFRLNYRRSIQRPGINQLSPINFKDDTYAISYGNPNLKPTYADRFELTHRIQLKGPAYFSYKPYLTFVKNGIQLLSVGSDTIRKYYENVSNEYEYGLNLMATVFPVKWFEISQSFTYYERALQAVPKYDIPSQTATSWRISVSSKVTLPKDWSLFLNYRYNAPYLSQQNKFERNYNMAVGFNKMVNKNFNIQVMYFCPGLERFVYNKTTTNTDNLQVHSVSSVRFPYIINIRLKYSFNVGKEGKKVEKDADSDASKGGPM